MKRLLMIGLRCKIWLWLVVVIGISSTQVSAQTSEMLTALSWSPDGGKLAVGGDSGDVYVWDAVDFTVLSHFHAQETLFLSIAWNPDSTEIAVFDGRSGQIGIWDASRAEQIVRLELTPVTGASVGFVDWSRNDVLAAIRYVEEGNDNIHLWDATNYQFIDHSLDYRVLALGLHWNADGTRLAVGDAVLGNFVFNHFSPDASPQYLGPAYTVLMNWSPDGNQLAIRRDEVHEVTYKGYIELINISDGSVAHSFCENNDFIYRVAWSPDGKSLAMLEGGGLVKLFDVASEQVIDRFQKDTPGVVLGWSPFGGRLVVANRFLEVNDETPASPTSSLSERVRSAGDNQLRVIVPLASLDWLGQVASYCIAAVDQPSDEVLALLSPEAMIKLTLDQLLDFIEQVKALPVDAIPPACAADLIAVAEALMAQ